MVRHFCDKCGEELDDTNKGCGKNMVARAGGIKVRVSVISPDVMPVDEQEPEYCKYCLLDVAGRIDDRPTSTGR